MKREGKNTTTLLSIKGFLWEDIKSLPIFLSAPASGNIPAGSTHSSPFRSATVNFYVCVQQKTKGGESCWNPCACAAGWARQGLAWLRRLRAANSHTHTFEFLRKIAPMAFFLMPDALTSAKLSSCVSGNSLLGTIHAYCPPHQRVSESDGWAYNHTPKPIFNSQNVTPWMGFTVWDNYFLVRKTTDSENAKNG